MICDVSSCDHDAHVLVHFKNVQTPRPYCYDHGTRNGDVERRFGRFAGSGNARRWVTAVRHAQLTSPSRRNQ